MAALSVVGQRITRVDGPDKVTGSRLYTADVQLAGTLWGKALRSPYPHARILRIDTSAARVLRGVHAVLTAADLPARFVGRRVYDLPLLATDRVRFVGEKIAVVAAEDPDVAEEAISLIDVEYEEVPAVFDPDEAMLDGAPILHPNFASYKNAPNVPPIPNVHSHVRWGRGNVDEGFAAADVVYEDRFSMPIQHHAFLEPQACVVDAASGGRVRLWTSNKQPFSVRAGLADLADLDPEQITVLPVSIGGDFGGKGSLVDVPHAYFLSKAAGRPVRMVTSFTDELTGGTPRHAATISIKSGLTADGRLLAQHARLVFNGGAYCGHKPHVEANLTGAEAVCGVYKTPHTLMESLSVYTNQVPCGHMRGPGWIQGAFAIESHMDMLASRLGMDPVEFRRLNVLDADATAPMGDHWTDFRAREVLELAVQRSGWKGHPRAANVGRGLSLTYEHVGTGRSGAIMTADESGKVTLLTAVPDVGTGAHTLFRQLAAEELTIPPEDVIVEIGDTDSAPFDTGSGADRVTHVAGTAVRETAMKLKDELCDLAAELMGWGEGSVRLEDGAFHGDGTDSVPFRDMAGRAARVVGGSVRVRHEIVKEGHLGDRNVTAQVAEVEVDPETGQVAVRRLISVQDIGRVLNPTLAEGQVQGGAMIGFGYALMEDLHTEMGRVTTANLGDYRLPCAADVPPFEVVFLPSEEGPAPYGAKPVGEVAVCGPAPAIANAVYDAVGVRITDLPITAERVYEALQAKRVRERAGP